MGYLEIGLRGELWSRRGVTNCVSLCTVAPTYHPKANHGAEDKKVAQLAGKNAALAQPTCASEDHRMTVSISVGLQQDCTKVNSSQCPLRQKYGIDFTGVLGRSFTTLRAHGLQLPPESRG